MEFKDDDDRMLFSFMNPILIMIYADLYNYALDKHRVKLVVTQTFSTAAQDKKLGRVSSAHREGRAIDIRTRNLDPKVIKDLCNYINTHFKYKKYKYMTRTGGERLAYYHNAGHGAHIHLAIHSRYKVDNPLN